MKRIAKIGILSLLIAAAIATCADYHSYRQAMQDVRIIHYIAGSGSGYSTVYLTAVVPLEAYQEDTVITAIRRYVAHRNKGIPDSLQIVLYNSMEQLQKGESYFEKVFRQAKGHKASTEALPPNLGTVPK